MIDRLEHGAFAPRPRMPRDSEPADALLAGWRSREPERAEEKRETGGENERLHEGNANAPPSQAPRPAKRERRKIFPACWTNSPRRGGPLHPSHSRVTWRRTPGPGRRSAIT